MQSRLTRARVAERCRAAGRAVGDSAPAVRPPRFFMGPAIASAQVGISFSARSARAGAAVRAITAGSVRLQVLNCTPVGMGGGASAWWAWNGGEKTSCDKNSRRRGQTCGDASASTAVRASGTTGVRHMRWLKMTVALILGNAGSSALPHPRRMSAPVFAFFQSRAGAVQRVVWSEAGAGS
jgi:hypothetical protein